MVLGGHVLLFFSSSEAQPVPPSNNPLEQPLWPAERALCWREAAAASARPPAQPPGAAGGSAATAPSYSTVLCALKHAEPLQIFDVVTSRPSPRRFLRLEEATAARSISPGSGERRGGEARQKLRSARKKAFLA